MIFRFVLFIFIICLSLQHLTCKNENQIFHVALNGNNSIKYNWMLDYEAQLVIIEIHLPLTNGWFAVGFSDRGQHFPADYCILWYDLKRRIHFEDAWADDQAIIHRDEQQDCQGFKIKRQSRTIKFTYRRKFDTCDPHDYLIEDGTTHIVWARNDHYLYKLDGLNISATSTGDNGMVRVQLLKNIDVNLDLPSHVRRIDVVTSNVNVPAADTTYWCHVQKLTDVNKKHHIYKFEAVVPEDSEGVVHHMEVFHCEAPPDVEFPLYKGDCFAKNRPEITQKCKKVLAAWAMGALAFIYPDEAGLPFGGPDFNPYVMLEIHYNNPELRSGIVDSSGVRMYVSSVLKQMDAGIIELGLEYTDKMAIPPEQKEFHLTGYCVSECTAVSLPLEGITVFGSQLHTHLTGIQVYTKHVRDGAELLEMNRDDHYSPHFQEIRRLKRSIRVLPGDALITRCTYGTRDRTNITLGGFGTRDEMCVNYIYYFPAINLEVCKSSISDQALSTYFNYMTEWEDQSVSTNKGISDNYKSIEWNKMRVQLLDEVYKESPLSMQCNMSNGDRFPGYWENTPVTPILKPLPPPKRQC